MITDIKPKHVKHFYMIYCYKCEKVIQSYRSRQDVCFLANKIFGWKYDADIKMVLCNKCFKKMQEEENIGWSE